MADPRGGFASYYDLKPAYCNDVPFYVARLPPHGAAVLELGCGTGRVSIHLAALSRRFAGVDHSLDMASRCRARLAQAGIPEDRTRVEVADLTELRLGERFDLIVAPFRVIQNLETGEQLRGLFRSIREHMAPGGRCILNVFRPNRPRAELVASWVRPHETEEWRLPTPEGAVVCLTRRARITADPLILYPDIVYRRYHGDEVVEESVLPLAMRCYYSDEFLDHIRAEGFHVLQRWGGYDGEPYGEGPELVVEFCDGHTRQGVPASAPAPPAQESMPHRRGRRGDVVP